jgi:hypothetical protein
MKDTTKITAAALVGYIAGKKAAGQPFTSNEKSTIAGIAAYTIADELISNSSTSSGPLTALDVGRGISFLVMLGALMSGDLRWLWLILPILIVAFTIHAKRSD